MRERLIDQSVPGDEGAAPLDLLQHADSGESVQGLTDRGAADAELLGQFPFRGQLGAGLPISALDPRIDRSDELPVERLLVFAVDHDGGSTS